MSAAEALYPELSAPARTFQTVKGAIIWYAEHRSRKESARAPLEIGSVPVPAVSRAVAEATYARLAACLVERAPEDYDFDPLVTDGRVEGLLLWYITDGGASDWKQRNEARFGMTWCKFSYEARRTRNVVRRRMQARGLIE